MDDLVGTAVRATAERHRADEWAVVLAAGNIPHRLRPRLDGWALIVSTRDAEAAREALDAYERENVVDTVDVDADAAAPVRGATVVGVAIGLLLIGFFAVTGTRASRSIWFERDRKSTRLNSSHSQISYAVFCLKKKKKTEKKKIHIH